MARRRAARRTATRRTARMAVRSGNMDMGTCKCWHHKWLKGGSFVVAGGVLLYTGSWAWAIIAFGILMLLGKNCSCGCGSKWC